MAIQKAGVLGGTCEEVKLQNMLDAWGESI